MVSPDSSVPVPECMKNLNTFPKDISWGAGGVMQLGEEDMIVQSFMITSSCRFGDCSYWKLLPEYTTCLG